MSSKFRVVFGDMEGDVRAWAATHAQAIGRSRFDLMGYAATLQDTFVPMGFARDQAAAFSKGLTELAVDMASFNNASEPETVSLLTSALVGNHEAVRRFGVIITEASLKAKLLEMGIAGSVQAATEQQKIMARLAIILASTKDAQGDAARTSGEFANQMRALRGQVKDVVVSFQTLLMPAAAKVVGIVKEAVAWVAGLSEEQRLLVLKMALVAAAAGPLLTAIGLMGLGMVTLGNIVGGLIKAFSWLATTMSVTRTTALFFAAAAVLVIKNWEQVSAFFVSMWEYIKATFRLGGAAIRVVLAAMDSAVVKSLQWIEGRIIAFFQWVVDKASAFENWPILGGMVKSAQQKMADWSAANEAWAERTDAAFEAAKESVRSAKGEFDRSGDAMVDATFDMGQAMASDIDGAIKALAELGSFVMTMPGEFAAWSAAAEEAAAKLKDMGAEGKSLEEILQGIMAAAQDMGQDVDAALVRQTKIENANLVAARQAFESAWASGNQRKAAAALAGIDLITAQPPGFAQGGMVPGPIGAPMLAMVHGGERIQTPAQQAGGGRLEISGTVRVEGVNNRGELVGVTEIVSDQIGREVQRDQDRFGTRASGRRVFR